MGPLIKTLLCVVLIVGATSAFDFMQLLKDESQEDNTTAEVEHKRRNSTRDDTRDDPKDDPKDDTRDDTRLGNSPDGVRQVIIPPIIGPGFGGLGIVVGLVVAVLPVLVVNMVGVVLLVLILQANYKEEEPEKYQDTPIHYVYPPIHLEPESDYKESDSYNEDDYKGSSHYKENGSHFKVVNTHYKGGDSNYKGGDSHYKGVDSNYKGSDSRYKGGDSHYNGGDSHYSKPVSYNNKPSSGPQQSSYESISGAKVQPTNKEKEESSYQMYEGEGTHSSLRTHVDASTGVVQAHKTDHSPLTNSGTLKHHNAGSSVGAFKHHNAGSSVGAFKHHDVGSSAGVTKHHNVGSNIGVNSSSSSSFPHWKDQSVFVGSEFLEHDSGPKEQDGNIKVSIQDQETIKYLTDVLEEAIDRYSRGGK